MACSSESYFAAPLRRAGSTPLVMLGALMTTEGYVIDATAVRALGDGASDDELRDHIVREHARWQRLSFGVVSAMFSRPATAPSPQGSGSMR